MRGVLVIGVLAVEIAGMLAGAKLSVSAPFLWLALIVLVFWPELEARLHEVEEPVDRLDARRLAA
jgi:hypothetical protein